MKNHNENPETPLLTEIEELEAIFVHYGITLKHKILVSMIVFKYNWKEIALATGYEVRTAKNKRTELIHIFDRRGWSNVVSIFTKLGWARRCYCPSEDMI